MISAEKKDFRILSKDELTAAMVHLQEKPFRAKQLDEWLWKKGAASFDEMTNLSKELREKLKNNYFINSLSTDEKQVSKDGTIKLRFKTFDNHFVEGVLIPAEDRMTACLSSQVGCSLTCGFCATGKLERKRNLNFDEIFDQVVLINNESVAHYQKQLTNIVFMGMGEPLLNYGSVKKSIGKITSPEGLAMSPRRITISTAGIAKMIKKLADDGVRIRLALSLHAAIDEKRNTIMPINEQNNLASLVEAMNYFYKKTFNRISFEYILFHKFNDSIEDARQLLKICQQVPARVNLIEYNSVEGVAYNKSKEDRTVYFCDFLNNHGITATIRRSRGKDIDAACGQLANKSANVITR
ncbi:MAG: 23S rRNA (adenine(2503)-C(2))-methyltransferase RlmN [Chitinophagales bacterium]|nr:23S rRNA (adenine(2503)-C(2))-methyltransferase RlmN [Chitinophagales bacterium]